jgi:hypothetical protein
LSSISLAVAACPVAGKISPCLEALIVHPLAEMDINVFGLLSEGDPNPGL